MRNSNPCLAAIIIVTVVFAMGALASGIAPSFADQKTAPRERYQYRVLKEFGFGRALDPRMTRDPFESIEPPKELEEYLNRLGKDGWEVVDLRIRRAHSELKAKRRAPGYFLYSEAGENAPRFLRLRRRTQ